MRIFCTEAKRYVTTIVCAKSFDYNVFTTENTPMQITIKQIHRRRTDKACDKSIDRIFVDCRRCIDLLYNTLIHNHYTVG